MVTNCERSDFLSFRKKKEKFVKIDAFIANDFYYKEKMMIKEVIHIGVTVSDMEKSIAFYRDTLGLKMTGRLWMSGPRTDLLFGWEGADCRVTYWQGSDDLSMPPVELIQFTKTRIEKRPMSLRRTGVSEICFRVTDIDKAYQRLREKGVEFLSAPQYFDFRSIGMGQSKAVYFRDPDGTILELIEPLR